MPAVPHPRIAASAWVAEELGAGRSAMEIEAELVEGGWSPEEAESIVAEHQSSADPE
jgi:hypothetical protein